MTARRVGSVIRLAPGKADEYRSRHSEVWPSVVANLVAAGVTSYSIFIYDDLLFGYLEYSGDNYEADMEALSEKAETRKWRSLMAELQQPMESIGPGEWWAEMTEVFHLSSGSLASVARPPFTIELGSDGPEGCSHDAVSPFAPGTDSD